MKEPVLCLLTGLMLAACQTTGQPASTLNFEPQAVYDANAETYWGFAFGDISGDGRLDLAVIDGGYGGPLIWFANTGSSPWERHVIAEKGPSGDHFSAGDIDVGDIDGDGDIDVLGIEHPGEWTWQNDRAAKIQPSHLFWFENTGQGQGSVQRPSHSRRCCGQSPCCRAGLVPYRS